MNKIIIVIIGVFALLVLAGFMAARLSRQVPELGLKDGKLSACPSSPNCICTENGIIGPIPLHGRDAQHLWKRLQQVISEQGGRIQSQNDYYLWATFKSPFFGFIDDLEARMDNEKQAIQLRSASRIGYYDLGINQKRMNRIRLILDADQ